MNIYEAYVTSINEANATLENFMWDLVDYVNYDIGFSPLGPNAPIFDVKKYKNLLKDFTSNHSKLYRVWTGLTIEQAEAEGINLQNQKFLSTTTSISILNKMAKGDGLGLQDAKHEKENYVITVHKGTGIDVNAALNYGLKIFKDKSYRVRYSEVVHLTKKIQEVLKYYGYINEIILFNNKSKLTKSDIYGFIDYKTMKVVKK